MRRASARGAPRAGEVRVERRPLACYKYASEWPVAQQRRRLPDTQKIVGASPTRPTGFRPAVRPPSYDPDPPTPAGATTLTPPGVRKGVKRRFWSASVSAGSDGVIPVPRSADGLGGILRRPERRGRVRADGPGREPPAGTLADPPTCKCGNSPAAVALQRRRRQPSTPVARTPTMATTATGRVRMCCFLHGDDPARPCPQPARFVVSTAPHGYDDYTEACGDHVEDLKCTPADTVERITSPS